MSEEPEQIGELSYLPNSNYPYPFDVERPPHFWMTEQTGRLADAVDVYFNGERLDPQQFSLIKQYLRQYVERAILPADTKRYQLFDRIDSLRNIQDIERYADDLSDVGIEPF